MMQPRCAVCDGDKQLETYCDWHYWLKIIKHNVDAGMISDWPPFESGRWPAVVKHREMLFPGGMPSPLSWQVALAVMLGSLDVRLSETPEDSAGDWLAVNGLLELPDNDAGTGRAA